MLYSSSVHPLLILFFLYYGARSILHSCSFHPLFILYSSSIHLLCIHYSLSIFILCAPSIPHVLQFSLSTSSVFLCILHSSSILPTPYGQVSPDGKVTPSFRHAPAPTTPHETHILYDESPPWSTSSRVSESPSGLGAPATQTHDQPTVHDHDHVSPVDDLLNW
jgi:hypothetical protein